MSFLHLADLRYGQFAGHGGPLWPIFGSECNHGVGAGFLRVEESSAARAGWTAAAAERLKWSFVL